MGISTRTLKDTALETGSGAQGGKVVILVNMDDNTTENSNILDASGLAGHANGAKLDITRIWWQLVQGTADDDTGHYRTKKRRSIYCIGFSMTITNTKVVDTTSKYIVQSKGIGNEEDQIVVDAEKLTSGNNESKVNLIECYYQIKGTGTLKFSAESETNDLSLTGNGKYGLRPDQLKFGNDRQIKLTTDSNVESYLLITEFRRN
jgi:hypothetical protein